jgi:MFS superfamily sulfate permease-like transporter
MIKKKAPTIPGAIVLSLFGIGLGFASTRGFVPIEIPTLFSKYGTLSLQLFPSAFPKFSLSPFLFQSASVIALIAIIETMLSAKVANLMTKPICREA